MNKVYLVYSGDAWLSSLSCVLKGVFTSKELAIKAILEEIKKYSIEEKNDMLSSYWEDDLEDEDDFDGAFQDLLGDIREMLDEHRQTQGFDTNYIIDIFNMNEIW